MTIPFVIKDYLTIRCFCSKSTSNRHLRDLEFKSQRTDDRVMELPLTNEQLRADRLPSPADRLAVLRFAGMFDGYAEMGGFHESASLANAALARYVSGGELPESLTRLRNCLFFEHRRWRHYGEDPDAEAQAYIDALMEAIRLRVVSGELD